MFVKELAGFGGDDLSAKAIQEFGSHRPFKVGNPLQARCFAPGDEKDRLPGNGKFPWIEAG